MNIQHIFLDCNSNPISSRKALFTQVLLPQISSSWLTNANTVNITTSVDGVMSASVVANNYKVVFGTLPETAFYMTVSETGSFVYSGSNRQGVAQDVFFNVFDFVRDATTTKRITLTPSWNYPVTFSGSIILLASTSSVPTTNGFSEFDALVPGVYQVDVQSKATETFFISVPAWENTGSDAPKWNAKDLLIVKPSKGIPVKLYNADSSYVLTVSSSDARYMRVDGSGSIYSASYAQRATNADTASLSFNAVSASYAYTASYALNGGSPASSSWASSSVSASHADTASYALNATPTVSASWASSSISASHANVVDWFNYNGYTYLGAAGANVGTSTNAIVVGNTGGPVTASNAVIMGTFAAGGADNATNAVIIGNGAGRFDTACNAAVLIGMNVATASLAVGTVAIGNTAARSVVTSSGAVVIGNSAQATYQTDITNAVIIGASASGSVNSIAIGANVTASRNQTVIGSTTTTSTFIRGPITASYIGARLLGTASHALVADTASFATSASYNYINMYNEVVASASWASSSLSASYVTASAVIGTVTSASYALTASYALNGGSGGSTVSSSWASSSMSASYASESLSSSYANTSSYANVASTSSVAALAITASYLSGSARLQPDDSIVMYDGLNFLYLKPENDAFKFYASSWGMGKQVRIGDGCQVTADFFIGTASWAQNCDSGSWSSASISASYADVASTLTWYGYSSSLNNHTQAIVVVDGITSSYDGVWYDYVAISGSEGAYIKRAGTVIGTWDDLGNVEYTDTSTNGLNGDSSDLKLSIAISESHVRLLSGADTYVWSVKASARYI